MPKYSEEKRQAVLSKLLPPHNMTPKEIADQEHVSLAPSTNGARKRVVVGVHVYRTVVARRVGLPEIDSPQSLSLLH